MKKCSSCRAELSETMFYKNRRNKTGLSYACKDCLKARTETYRQNNREKAVACARTSRIKNAEKHQQKCREYNKLHRKQFGIYNAIYTRKYPEKKKATTAVSHALRDGQLVRPSGCSTCGNSPLQAHHGDYSKPLDVLWLCQPCHVRLHSDLRQAD